MMEFMIFIACALAVIMYAAWAWSEILRARLRKRVDELIFDIKLKDIILRAHQAREREAREDACEEQPRDERGRFVKKDV